MKPIPTTLFYYVKKTQCFRSYLGRLNFNGYSIYPNQGLDLVDIETGSIENFKPVKEDYMTFTIKNKPIKKVAGWEFISDNGLKVYIENY